MKSNFLEPDFLFAKRIVVFGVTRVTSEPTVDHIKHIDSLYDNFINYGIDDVYNIVVTESPMAGFLVPKLSKKIKFEIDTDNRLIVPFQQLMNKKGNLKFLRQYWHFACVIENGQVTFQVDQPFMLQKKISVDTREKIYSNVGPEKVLDYLHRSSIG